MDTSFFPIIKACKSSGGKDEYYRRVKNACMERVGLEAMRDSDIAWTLLHILEAVGTNGRRILWWDIFRQCDPEYFPSMGIYDGRSYWGRLIDQFSSEIANTEVKYIPGYREWHDAQVMEEA